MIYYSWPQWEKSCCMKVDLFCGPNYVNIVFTSKVFFCPFDPVLYLIKSQITNRLMPIVNVPLLIYLLASINKIILSEFPPVFLFTSLTLMWITLEDSVYPLFLLDTLFVENIYFQGLYIMLRLFQKFHMKKLSCIYSHYFPYDLSNTIFPDPSGVKYSNCL